MYRQYPTAVLILIGLAAPTVLNAQEETELCQRGMARIEKGDLDGGIADLDQALKANPDFAEAYFARGYAWDKKGDCHKAIADFDQVIRLAPTAAEPRFNRGRM